MKVDLWRVKHELVRENLTGEEKDFIYGTFAQCDDGSWNVDEEILNDAVKTYQEEKAKIPEELVMAIRKELKGLSKGMILSLAVLRK